MDSKPAQNIQDTFLNTVRKDKSPITIYLVSGVKLTGKNPFVRQVFRAAGEQQPGTTDLQARDLNRSERPARGPWRGASGGAESHVGLSGTGDAGGRGRGPSRRRYAESRTAAWVDNR